MSLPLLELLKAETTETLYASLLRSAEALVGGTSTDVTFLEGKWGVWSNVAYGTATIFSSVFVPAVVSTIEACFGDTAVGVALDRYCLDTYNTAREEGQFAAVPVVFTNSSALPAIIAVGDRVLLQNSTTGAQYSVDGPFNIPALGSTPAPGLPGALTARAQVIGTSANAAINSITIVVGSILPPEITVTNPVPGFGLDRETDAAYLERARLSLAPLSPNGPDEAYLASALNATRPDGSAVDVTRAQVIEDLITGSVTVYYASATGPTADLVYVVDAANREVRPKGVDYTGLSAVAVVVNVAATITIKASFGLTAPQITTLCTNKLIELFPTLELGGGADPLSQYKLEQALGDVVPKANPIVVTSPVPALIVGEVATLGTVTITTVFV